jgi:hypothetical protein
MGLSLMMVWDMGLSLMMDGYGFESDDGIGVEI